MFPVHVKAAVAAALIPPCRAVTRYGSGAMLHRPFSKSVFRHLAWRSHDFVVGTPFGFRFAGDTQDLVSRFVYYFGAWEPEITSWICPLPLQGGTVIDVGANMGWYSLLASRLVGPAGRVVAVEASKRTFALLERNIRLNNCGNIRTLNVAVWHRREDLKLFYAEDLNTGESTVVPELAHSITPDEVVSAAPLCDLLTAEETRAAALVKIDVEGAEAQAIEGLLPLLPRFAPDVRFVIEVKPGVLSSVRPAELLRPFTDAGFRAYRLPNAYTSDYYVDCGSRKASVPQPVDISSLSNDADLLLTRAVL